MISTGAGDLSIVICGSKYLRAAIIIHKNANGTVLFCQCYGRHVKFGLEKSNLQRLSTSRISLLERLLIIL
jgi:hypothetical protein